MNNIKIYQPMYFAEIYNPNWNYVVKLDDVNNDIELQKKADAILNKWQALKVGNRYIKATLVSTIYKEDIRNDLDFLIQSAPSEVKQSLINSKREVQKQGKDPTIIRVWNYYLYHYRKQKELKDDWTIDNILHYLKTQYRWL